MDPITAIGFVASLVQLIDVTTKTICYLNDIKDAPKDRARIALEVTSLLALLTSLRYRVEESETSDPWLASLRSLAADGGPLQQFQVAMDGLAKKLKPEVGAKKFGKALLWTLDKKGIMDLLGNIERLKTLIELALQADHFKLLQAIRKDTYELPGLVRGVEALHLDLSDGKRQAILDWLSPLNFAVNQNDFSSRRQAGTGKWLLETADLQRLARRRAQNCLVSRNSAGKTILASVIVNHLQQTTSQRVGIAYLYCNYKEPDHTAANLVGALVRQLVQTGPEIPSDIVSLYETQAREKIRPSLDKYSTMLKREADRFSKVYVVIDALDEYHESDGSRDTIFAELQEIQIYANLLVTSRHITSIEREFENAARLEILASDEDVQRYLEGRVQAERRLMRIIGDDSLLQKSIVTTIVENAKGI